VPQRLVRVSLAGAVLLASVLLHLGLLGAIVLAERRVPTASATEAIEIELVQASELEPQKTEPPQPDPPKPEPKLDLPVPAEAAAPAPAPAPPPADTQLAHAPAQEPRHEPPPPPAPQPRPESGGAPGEGKSKLTVQEIAALRAQIQKCWTLPIGLPNAMQLEAVVRVRLAPNGGLSAPPELLKANASSGGPVLVGIAMKALRECAPYRVLPAAKYADWKMLDLRFLATGMTGLGSAKPPAKPAG
jgi:hypothetical protein